MDYEHQPTPGPAVGIGSGALLVVAGAALLMGDFPTWVAWPAVILGCGVSLAFTASWWRGRREDREE